MKFTFSSLSSFVLDYVLFSLMMFFMPHTAVYTLLANIAARAVSAFYNYINRNMKCQMESLLRRNCDGKIKRTFTAHRGNVCIIAKALDWYNPFMDFTGHVWYMQIVLYFAVILLALIRKPKKRFL